MSNPLRFDGFPDEHPHRGQDAFYTGVGTVTKGELRAVPEEMRDNLLTSGLWNEPTNDELDEHFGRQPSGTKTAASSSRPRSRSRTAAKPTKPATAPQADQGDETPDAEKGSAS